jgi:predicted DNA-binding transcriptional regulator AlpA
MTRKAKSSFPKPQRAIPPSAPVEATGPMRLLSKKQVLDLLGVTHVTLWDWVRKGHFPAGVVLGPEGGHRTTMRWIDTEVYHAIANMPRRRGQQVDR